MKPQRRGRGSFGRLLKGKARPLLYVEEHMHSHGCRSNPGPAGPAQSLQTQQRPKRGCPTATGRALPSSAQPAGPLPPPPPGRPGRCPLFHPAGPGRSPLLRPDGRAAVRGGGGAAGGGGGGWLAAVGRTCGGIELGVVAAPAPFGKDGRFWGTGGCGGHSSVVSALGATEGATGGGENWAESEGHEPEAAERRAVQPLESPLRQPERSPAARNAVGGQNCGRILKNAGSTFQEEGMGAKRRSHRWI